MLALTRRPLARHASSLARVAVPLVPPVPPSLTAPPSLTTQPRLRQSFRPLLSFRPRLSVPPWAPAPFRLSISPDDVAVFGGTSRFAVIRHAQTISRIMKFRLACG
ncbi:hypothetical protein Saso_65720 [Streptomyces asoensis]|uniref:Uncharacterized protein n=1 Tax=Streptomyces asoensis TaxID=249586 RepID=A0ABQ3SAE5_9ACTN|nr:hypothetical protein GCM10010496_70340 [Streptomyces asoensis]GHI64922.1 hypothetical protein Saso_65720 [Streptomyces asoensis]